MSKWIQEGATIHTETGWLGDCDAAVDATWITTNHNAACDAYEARIADREAKLQQANKRANDAEHRLEFPPMTQNQDELARICYEGYMEYMRSDGLADNPWDELDAWESYGWRLAADRVRVAVEAAMQGGAVDE